MINRNRIRIIRQTRNTKKDRNLSTIFLRIFVLWNGRIHEFIVSTRESLPTDQWDNLRKLGRGTKESIQRFNNTLKGYEEIIGELFEQYRSTERVFNIDNFKALISKDLFGIDKGGINLKPSLPDLFDSYITRHNSNLGHSRKRRYSFVKQKVIDFTYAHFGTDKFDYDLLDNDWYYAFKEYLKVSFNYQVDTLTGYLKILRAVVNDACERKIIKEHPFAGCALEYGEHDIKYLNLNELQRIENFKSNDSRIQLVADCFVFACHTGISHGDMRKFKRGNIRPEKDRFVIEIKRIKTNVESLVPLDQKAMSIIEKYKDCSHNGLLLPVPYINEYNDRLKLIAAKCGINRNLTSHIARHTFATTVWLENAGSIEVLQKILGHKNIRTTQRYGRITAQRVVGEASKIMALAQV